MRRAYGPPPTAGRGRFVRAALRSYPRPVPHPSQPPDHVLDLFAAEGVLEPLPGGRGTSWRAGDLVVSPGHDESEAWLAPIQARLAVRLDLEPTRSLRLALPVPARDGNLTVDGWAATRFEPGTTPCHDLAILRATAHLLHAHLASAVPERPPALAARTDQWAEAERAAYDPELATVVAAHRPEPGLADLVGSARRRSRRHRPGPRAARPCRPRGQRPAGRGRRPVRHRLLPRVALAAVGRGGVRARLRALVGRPADALDEWRTGAQRQAMLRAALFRVLSDQPCDVRTYDAALATLLS